MILLDLKNYLQQRKHVNLQELALHFQTDPEMVRDMMQHWIRKGKVCEFKPAGCGTRCIDCKPALREVYSWV